MSIDGGDGGDGSALSRALADKLQSREVMKASSEN